MTSPLEQKLLTSLNAVQGSEARALVLAELGAYWARVGERERAEQARKILRQEFGSYLNPRVSILIIVLEALQAYYGDLSPLARDRMLRASLLSKGFREQGLIALTSAWMAHIEFNHSRFDSMVTEISRAFEALAQSADDPGFTPCRLALTLGDANLFAGLAAQSQAWYEIARQEASRRGDHAAVGALTYNRAALRVARARFDALAQVESGIDRTLLRLDVESAINYQAAARLSSLEHLLASSKASLLVLQAQYEAAVEPLLQLLSGTEVPQKSAERLLLRADLALSLAQCGRLEEARVHLEECFSSYSDVAFVLSDDQCVIASSVSESARLCAIPNAPEAWSAQLKGAIEQHSELCQRLREQLVQFPPVPFRTAH